MDSHANEYGFSLNVPVRPTPTPEKPRQHNKKPPPNQQVCRLSLKLYSAIRRKKDPGTLVSEVSASHLSPVSAGDYLIFCLQLNITDYQI